MTYKLRHVGVLFFALFLGAAAMYVELNPWLRMLIAGFLLIPIIYAADGLGVPRILKVLPAATTRDRRFSVLRSQVVQLLDVVRLLNWLTVDLERGVRKEGVVKAEIALAEQRLEELLTEIRNAAGRYSTDAVVDEETESVGSES